MRTRKSSPDCGMATEMGLLWPLLAESVLRHRRPVRRRKKLFTSTNPSVRIPVRQHSVPGSEQRPRSRELATQLGQRCVLPPCLRVHSEQPLADLILRTHNLTWAVQANSGIEGPIVNHSVRLLGRGGMMHADLVTDPEQMATAMGAFNEVVSSHTFLPGRRYAEWVEGDKVAAYGLTALVAGGAGAVAMKTGIAPFLPVNETGRYRGERSACVFSGFRQ